MLAYFSSSFQLKITHLCQECTFLDPVWLKGMRLFQEHYYSTQGPKYFTLTRRLLTAGVPDLSASFPEYIHTLGVEDIYFGTECKIYTVSTYMPLGLRTE
jgi:hypothetical protein